ncbi:MAG: hypothetical protein CGU28_03260 [Candidatus Dactylopiibacterium carminicum]|uniref:PTS lactose transporter subunit IIC n=1 Tax=Candidatus Dactylopiibacterium carminicum TaxID=857335 RepID=A0A272EYK3_9RHOO|nr:EAL domain-containing protein [Candidatus Dactylopiibacterium carminicum]KAF7600598.1 hypothetical protein BGI27_01560 [Candidatus Dactylopiibacterium carminicum]PAS95165.1 MAG: hypothetical protein CGU29_01605 [Candidatus Dactylopiibacterium carminicum]PAS97968.1 MAG: hypothetical protein CGU28_03260 [Candidatus Dactylopiibacterium carminicum]PAT00601.1 MAG: hypothetical protein BSR46_01570 [Candidatus Dactylopiibacterium carminicum]
MLSHFSYKSSPLFRIAGNDWVAATRRGFLLTLPLIMVGAFAQVLLSVPWISAMDGQGRWLQIFVLVRESSSGVIALSLVITISHVLAGLRQVKRRLDFNPVVAVTVALMSFLVLMLPAGDETARNPFAVQAVFPAILVALLATELFIRLLGVRLLDLRAYRFNDGDLLLPGMLQAILPASLCIACFVFVQQMLGLGGGSVSSLLAGWTDALFAPLDSPLLRMLMFCLLSQLLWFFGAHGNNILGAVEARYLNAATDANAAAVAAGAVPTEIFSKPLFDVFVLMGGSGTALALLIAVLLFWRGSHQARLARFAFVPGLFNISEIIVYGLPVVLNPVFFIPFVLSPLLLVLVSGFATFSGFIPPIHQAVPWTTPPLLGGYLATGSWRGVALQLFNLALAVAVYAPFVRAARRQFNELRQHEFHESLRKMEALTTNPGANLLMRLDTVGSLARQLAQDLMLDALEGRLHLQYQPQVNAAGRVVGVEALLRWDHAVFGAVPPNIAVLISEEADLICPLGEWIVDQALRQQAQWLAQGMTGVRMSINISPIQLQDARFVPRLQEALARHGLAAGNVELEITEGRAVAHDDATVQTMIDLMTMGVRLAIDDFGMGYSSLLYMRRFSVDAIKLDGSLTREVSGNRNCQEIIETISHLCRTKQVRMVAEFVETEAQRDLLATLGCSEYQGHLYSRPLLPEDCRRYIARCNAGFEPPAPTEGAEVSRM